MELSKDRFTTSSFESSSVMDYALKQVLNPESVEGGGKKDEKQNPNEIIVLVDIFRPAKQSYKGITKEKPLCFASKST